MVHIEGRQYQCRLCPKKRRAASTGGYSNTVGHLKTAHADTYLDKYFSRRQAPAQPEIDSFLDHAVHADAVDTHGWLDWIVMDHLTIDFCEKKRARKYSMLGKTCAKTLVKRMEAVEEVVQGVVTL
jgi:hypothetical protein